jgi:glucose-1-phosphate cytidylyltransferase
MFLMVNYNIGKSDDQIGDGPFMKVVILAGGYGTRISEESHLRPKPMIDIGDKPILWHIMKLYSHYGFNDFVICCGYKGYMIKEYFANYYLHQSDVTFDFGGQNKMTIHNNIAEPWKVTLVDTGKDTATGGRIQRVKSYVGNEPFFLTYGDGVSDVNIKELLEFHRAHGKSATVTAVQPEGRWGTLAVGQDTSVYSFKEKPKGGNAWINGGFFVFQPEIFDYLSDDKVSLEVECLQKLAHAGQLKAFQHNNFWQAMDTLRDKSTLEEYWKSGKAPWKVWREQ